MVTGTDIRLVPMTREQRDWAKPDVREAYDDAPADPREVIAEWIYLQRWKILGQPWAEASDRRKDRIRAEALDTLAALGWTQEETT